MSLAQRVKQSVDKAFNSLDDLAGPMVIVSQASDPTYSASSGSLTKDEGAVTVEAIFDRYDTDRVDGTIIQTEDRLILAKPIDGLIPKIGDTIEDFDGIIYNIMDVDAVKAYNQVFLWEIRARR